MGIYLAEQTVLFLQAIVLGGVFGLLYDAFRITRIAVPTAKWVVFAQDVLFFFVCASATFLFLMRTLQGEVRFFIFLGTILGMVLYFNSLSVVIMGVSGAIIRTIKVVLRAIYRWVLLPIWLVFYNITLFIMRPVRFLAGWSKKTAQRCKYSLKVRRKVLYNQLGSALAKTKRKLATNVKKRRKKDTTGKEPA